MAGKPRIVPRGEAAASLLGAARALVKGAGDAKAPGPVGRWMRDRVVMPLFAAHLARAKTPPDAWLTGHHIDWDEPVHAAV